MQSAGTSTPRLPRSKQSVEDSFSRVEIEFLSSAGPPWSSRCTIRDGRCQSRSLDVADLAKVKTARRAAPFNHHRHFLQRFRPAYSARVFRGPDRWWLLPHSFTSCNSIACIRYTDVEGDQCAHVAAAEAGGTQSAVRQRAPPRTQSVSTASKANDL